MHVSKLMKNGSINLPSEIRRVLKIKAGDKISFIETDHGVVLVPIVDIFDLVDEKYLDKSIEIINEIREERRQMALNEEDT